MERPSIAKNINFFMYIYDFLYFSGPSSPLIDCFYRSPFGTPIALVSCMKKNEKTFSPPWKGFCSLDRNQKRGANTPSTLLRKKENKFISLDQPVGCIESREVSRFGKAQKTRIV